MAFSDTGKAIGMVSQLLRDHLQKSKFISHTGINVRVGRPEPSTESNGSPALNLFLYEAQFDASLRNVSLDEGQPAPLWLVLRYLMTAYHQGQSDNIEAHTYLGEAIRILQELSFVPLPEGKSLPEDLKIIAALDSNPEPLKITFDEVSSDLLSKLMQGSDEKYRFSVGFQVRPVLIVPDEQRSYSLLVGVDYTQEPPKKIGEQGIHIPVIPSMGPTINRVVPEKFEVGDTLVILGSNLHLNGLAVCLGAAELKVTAQQPDRLHCEVDPGVAALISTGNQPIAVVQTLPNGRRRSSNMLVGSLLPKLDKVRVKTQDGKHRVELTGALLGRFDENGLRVTPDNGLRTSHDDVLLALSKGSEVVKTFDTVWVEKPSATLLPQTKSLFIIPDENVPVGLFRLILRVNGQQAKNSPEVELP